MENKITPIDKEIAWDKSLELVSKTDKFGNIKYINENFVNVSGYEDYELVGKPHSIIRHPDMPSVIFKILWDHLKKGEDFHAVIKNMSKTGRYYWVITQFETQVNEAGEIVNYISRKKGVSEEVAKKIETLYFKLKQIENAVSQEAAEEYLLGFLDDKKLTYEEFLHQVLTDGTNNTIKDDAVIIDNNNSESNKSKKTFFSFIFG